MVKKQSGLVKASGLLFLLGIIIAIIAGIFKAWIDPTMITSVLVILGFVIGLLGAIGEGSIDKAEAEMFLLAVVALIAAGSSGAVLGNIPIIGIYLSDIVGYIAALVMPAAVLIALEAIWRAGSTKF